MKKELFSIIILIILLTVVLVNIHYLNNFTGEILTMVHSAEKDALAGSWDSAAHKAEKASKMWNSREAYTHTVLGHKDIDTASDAFYSFLEKIYSRNAGGTKAAAELLTYHLTDIGEMEKIKIGNIL